MEKQPPYKLLVVRSDESMNMTTSQACVFPAELIIRILYHADIRDIVRWRTVRPFFVGLVSFGILINPLW